MEKKVRNCPGCRRKSCDGCGILKQLHTNKQMLVSFPEGFVPEKGKGLGISFDIGTTTVAGMLWDLEQAVCLSAKAAANPQIPWGSDVISRLGFAMAGQAETELLQKKLVQAMDELAREMVSEAFKELRKEEDEASLGRQEEEGAEVLLPINRIVVAGNTAMCELFLGIVPQNLAKAPFMPDYQGVICKRGLVLGFEYCKEAEIYVLPPIGGYVGADALAVYSCIYRQAQKKNVLAVDIGTNGEILLLTPGTNYACSAAAGPALEGGGATYGMRATKGAIDAVSISGRFPMQDIVCHVIGEGKASGICGSGLLDALACLLKCGVIEQGGYLKSEKEARKTGVPERICKRIEETEHGNRIRLSDQETFVYLTGEDVRQLQLAIGAIRAGTEVLLKKAALTPEKLYKVCLAGAFGSYISVESCLAVGLLPSVEREKIGQAGNLAGTGAAMALLSERVLMQSKIRAQELVHVELAQDENFQELFLKHMLL